MVEIVVGGGTDAGRATLVTCRVPRSCGTGVGVGFGRAGCRRCYSGEGRG